jgi:ABC-type Fe3+-hydroxamate transport system substrate-binding protein
MPNYSVEYLGSGNKLLTDAMGRKILLYFELEKTEGFKADLQVHLPLSKVVACTPIHLAFALRLDKEIGGGIIMDKFEGVLNAAEVHLVLPDLVGRLRDGRLRDVRSISELKSLHPELVFAFEYPREDPHLVNILEKLKLPYVVLDAWYESDVVDRVEWMEFIAHFFNLEKEARLIREKIEDEIRVISDEAKKFSPSKVLWFVDFQDYVFVTGGRSWVAQSIKRLGSDAITPQPEAPGSVASSREWVAEKLKEADIIVFTMVRPSLVHLNQLYPGIAECSAFKNKKVYGFSLEYWQEGAYAPERWYMELSHILRQAPLPEELRVFVEAR